VRGFGDSRWQGFFLFLIFNIFYFLFLFYGFFEEAKLAMIIHPQEDLAKF